MRSMTGYGRAEENTPLGTVKVELFSVNHRNLDLRLRLPDTCRPLEIELREAVKKALRRGHVEGTLRIDADASTAARDIALNVAAATAYYNEAQKLRDVLGLDALPGIDWILEKPEVWQPPESPETGEIRAAVLPVFEAALGRLAASREREGASLAAFFEEKLNEIAPIIKEVEAFMPQLPHLVRDSLVKRLEELAQDPSLNPDRLAQEVAYLAQRADITEEVSRFGAHLVAFREKIHRADVSGRELDFTLQEMNREVNTMGSKSVAYALSNHVIRLKEILNQLREQVQNVE